MLSLLLLFAEEPPGPRAIGLADFLPFIAIAFVFYWLLIRPFKKQEQERQALVSALRKHDKVVTSAGIIGIVASIKEKEDEITLKIDENSPVRLKVLRSSVARILSQADEDPKESKEEKENNA